MSTICKKGYIFRDGYKKKLSTGKIVYISGSCIRSTSQLGRKRKPIEKKIMEKLRRSHQTAKKKFGTPKCKKGEIVREGYIKKLNSKKIIVPPVCIKSTSKTHPGKHGIQLFVMDKDVLGPFGYSNVIKLTLIQRHIALNKALKKITPLSLFRRLNALYVLNKGTKIGDIFLQDRDWIRETPQYKKRPTSKKR